MTIKTVRTAPVWTWQQQLLMTLVRHDLKWVEVVHGRATVKKPSRATVFIVDNTLKQNSALRRGDDLCSSQCC